MQAAMSIRELVSHFLLVVASILIGLGLIGCVIGVHQLLVVLFT